MSFTPITTQEELDIILKRRLDRQKEKHAKQVAILSERLLEAQQLLIDQSDLVDLIRRAFKEEISTLSGGTND